MRCLRSKFRLCCVHAFSVQALLTLLALDTAKTHPI